MTELADRLNTEQTARTMEEARVREQDAILHAPKKPRAGNTIGDLGPHAISTEEVHGRAAARKTATMVGKGQSKTKVAQGNIQHQGEGPSFIQSHADQNLNA